MGEECPLREPPRVSYQKNVVAILERSLPFRWTYSCVKTFDELYRENLVWQTWQKVPSAQRRSLMSA
jgi:hypothetical protein